MLFKRSSKNGIKIKRRTTKAKKNSRFLELTILAIFSLVVVYGASFALRISNGVSKTIDVPVQNIKLQILNGCGRHGIADKVAKALPTKVKLPLELSVVDIYDFRAFDVKKCFLISRSSDLSIAKNLAEHLGLDRENIVFEPLENNYRNIGVTLVIGEDYEQVLLKTKN
jgi:hypothetical protein